MKMYVFGDSYSVDYDHSCLFSHHDVGYIKWKGYVPKKYYHLLSENYNCEQILNFSKCGIDNGLIFEKFMDNFDSINSEDIIIFGWTRLGRFSINSNRVTEDGPDKNWSSSVSFNDLDWVKNASLNNETLIVNGQHTEVDLIHVDDASEGIAKATVNTNTNDQTYNLTSNINSKLFDTANLIIQTVKKGKVELRQADINYPCQGIFDNSKAKKDFDFDIKIPLNEGIVSYIRYIQNNK